MGAQEIGTPNQKQPQIRKSQCRNMKGQDDRSPSKSNSTTKELNNSEEKEMSDTEFQKI
jgi:hypothetical protein